MRIRRGTRDLLEAVIIGAIISAILLTTWARQQDIADRRDARSTDGRLHACGLVTEQGVTEHLNAYWDRCHEAEEGTGN